MTAEMEISLLAVSCPWHTHNLSQCELLPEIRRDKVLLTRERTKKKRWRDPCFLIGCPFTSH